VDWAHAVHVAPAEGDARLLPLPIDHELPNVLAGLDAASCVILRAPPGAGKTTRVPPALLEAPWAHDRQVWVLQPRRVAARSTAARMAAERAVRLGEEVGYHIRFDRRSSSRTRLLVMTEGVLTRRLLDDPFVEGVAAVVLDEFHERHVETDVALAMLRRIQQTVRPDLKLVVMSATLATDDLRRYLPEAPVISCEIRTHAVEIEYLAAQDSRPLPVQVAWGVRRMLAESSGHVLAFLPGVREIQQTLGQLQDVSAEVLPLYGDLPVAEQDRVFEPSGERKIVLATNVAETSITIPGVTAVVDSGWARVPELDPELGLNRLVLRPISQASAEQRAGRAGRTAPGKCLRLWTQAAQRTRPTCEVPEIHRVDLAGVVLQLRCWGESDARRFPWFDPPRSDVLDRAERLLATLDALDHAGPTPLGRLLAALPVHPRLGRLLVEGVRRGHRWEAALAAALLSERDPFPHSGRSPRRPLPSPSDVLDRVEALRDFYRTGSTSHVQGELLQEGLALRIRQVAEQLARVVPEEPSTPVDETSLEEALGRAVLAAFPDRVARRREPRSQKALMVGGRGVRLAETSAVTEAELFVALDVDAAGDDALVRLAAGIERAWLPATHLQTATDVEFDEESGRVQARRRTRWFDLVLEEAPAELPDDAVVAQVLAEAARRRWSDVYPPIDPGVEQLVARVRCLREWMPEWDLPTWDDAELMALLPEICWGCRSLEDLRRGRWRDVLWHALTERQRWAVEREAPEKIEVPSGRRIAVNYAAGRPPVMAVRIQEVFGWKETPRLAGGRVRVLLHLLAPNDRPQQITDDLPSFWTTAYPQIRGDLRRRYPKHAWPEDPWTAVPEKRPRR